MTTLYHQTSPCGSSLCFLQDGTRREQTSLATDERKPQVVVRDGVAATGRLVLPRVIQVCTRCLVVLHVARSNFDRFLYYYASSIFDLRISLQDFLAFQMEIVVGNDGIPAAAGSRQCWSVSSQIWHTPTVKRRTWQNQAWKVRYGSIRRQ